MSDDALLSEIRAAAPANADHINDLRDKLSGPSPIPLVPFIGAGLTIPIGFPGWHKFLTDRAKECGQSPQVAALLKVEKYEQAAETIEAALSPELFYKRIAHTFGKTKSDSCPLKGPALFLLHLQPPTISEFRLVGPACYRKFCTSIRSDSKLST